MNHNFMSFNHCFKQTCQDMLNPGFSSNLVDSYEMNLLWLLAGR